jgi:hypothetical protein
MRGQVKIRQTKLAARRRRRIVFMSVYGVAAAGIFLCGLSYISQLPSFAVSQITVEGNSRLSAAAIQSIVFKDLIGNYMGLFSKRNIFLYQKQAIQHDILALPLVKTATISQQGLTGITVSITERDQTSRWCSGVTGISDCYSVDDSGFIFAKAADAACTADHVCLVDSASSSASFIYRDGVISGPIGSHVLDSNQFKKIGFFMNQLTGLAVEPREAILSNSTTTSYMTILLAKGGKLIVNTADDLSVVLGNISSVISNRAVAPSLSQFLATLDYIKLDIGNKIVYKLKK